MSRIYVALVDHTDDQVAFRQGMEIKLADATAERLLREDPDCIRVVAPAAGGRTSSDTTNQPGPYRPQAALGDDVMHTGNTPLAKGWNG